MNLINITLDFWNITFTINIIVLIILLIFFILLNQGYINRIIAKLFKKFKINNYDIKEVKLGTGSTTISFKPNYTDREIAYKLWVELSTRKLGLPINFNEDVIIELYDSWYAFFSEARNLIKEFPISKLNENKKNLVEITIELLNNVLRVHLTTWQAKFRKWYNQELKKDENKNLTPQEIQCKYEYYDELTADLNKINEKINYYKMILYSISHDKELNE